MSGDKHEQSANLYMKLNADSGYEAECTGIRVSAAQWAVINEVANSKDGLSRRLLDSIYNKHVKTAS